MAKKHQIISGYKLDVFREHSIIKYYMGPDQRYRGLILNISEDRKSAVVMILETGKIIRNFDTSVLYHSSMVKF